MRKSVFRNAGMTVVQVLLSTIVLFLLYRFLLETLGVELLGVWSIVLATAMAARISELGFSGSVVKFVAKHLALDDVAKLSGIIQTATVSVFIVIGFVVIAVYYPLINLLAFIIPEKALADAISILPYALCSLWINAVAGVFQAGLDGCQRIDLRSWLLMGSSVLYLILAYALVPSHGLIGLAYSQLIQAAVVMLVGWLLLRREMDFLPIFPVRWSRRRFTEMFVYGINFQINSIMAMLYDPVTKALLSKFGGLGVVGYYEMANRMIMQGRSIIVSANQVLVPTIAGLHEKDSGKILSVYQQNYRLLFYLVIPFFCAMSVLVPVISEVWIGRYEELFVKFSFLLICGWVLNTLVSAAYFSNLGMGRLRWNTISHASIAFLNAGLGLVAGMIYGGTGVVWAWVIALVLGSSVVVIAYHHEYGIPYRELFPKESFWLTIGSTMGMTAGLLVYYFSHAYLVFPMLILLCMMAFILFALLPLLFHPMTARWMRWVSGVQFS